MKGKFWRKALAVTTSVLMLSGGVPIQPLSQVFEDIAITASAEGTTVDLSTLGSYTAKDGDVLTGSTSGTVTIADSANITLNNATISGGIVCEGSATITLVGENVVNQTSLSGIYKIPGIQIGSSGTTLTIKGDGSLNASGGSAAAGIGLGRTWDANATGGSIVIESGNITASGDIGIGIGTVGNSKTASLDGIIIKGGTINASLGSGYLYAGSSVTIGTITIYDGIDKVDASKITTSVTYMHDETDVTANASTYFTIIEDGDRRIIEKKDNTDYSITIADGIEHGSIAYAATTAKYGDKVTITATPDFGYRLSRLIVKDADNNDVASTGNSFFMPKSNVTVSAVFEQGTHGTTEFKLRYFTESGDEQYESFYDGVTTVNLQQWRSYRILKYENEYRYREFLLDNSTYEATIPYSGGTGTFPEYENGTSFNYNGESGFYDITMTDVGNDKWRVSILKTVGVIDNIPDQTYTGSEIKPEPLVLAGSLNLTKGTDYEYSYTNNTDAGTATVRATFKGNYASLGYVEKTFNIVYPDGIGAHLAGHSLSLTGNIGVNFYMELDANVIADEDAYMHFTLPNGKPQDVKIGQATTKTISGKTYYVFQCNVAAKEMTDTIKAQMFSGNKSGQVYEYTVKDYADYLFANAYEDDGMTVKNQSYVDAIPLVKAMLNYGSYSQTYFSHNTDAPANADITDTDVSTITAETVSKPYDSSTAILPSGITLEGANLALESETVLNLYFSNTTGKELTFTTSGNVTLDQKQDGTYTKVTITGIAAQYLDNDVTVNVIVAGDDTAYSVQYSPMNYCYNTLSRDTTTTRTEALKNVMRAFYLYNQKAKTYFTAHSN